MLEFASRSNCKRFLFISSAAVYGDRLNQGCDESTSGSGNPLDLRSCYEESKRLGENLVVSYGHQFNVNTVIVRPYHVYGPLMALGDGRVVSDFVENAVRREKIRIRGDGRATRTLLYIDDFVSGIMKILEHGARGQAYNLGNPYVELSTLEMASIISKLYDIDIELNAPVKQGYSPSPIQRMPINVSKVFSLGWQPKIGFSEGIKNTIDFSRKFYEMPTNRL